jgi:hypothetical protein
MSTADKVVDWHALGEVVLISAAAGLAIALTMAVGIGTSLRAQDHKGASAFALTP